MRTGATLSLRDLLFGKTLSLLVETVGNKGFLAAELFRPYDRLHLGAKELVFKSATPNRDNILCLERETERETETETETEREGSAERLLIATLQAHNGSRSCLGVTGAGELVSLSLDVERALRERNTSVHSLIHGTVSIWFSAVESDGEKRESLTHTLSPTHTLTHTLTHSLSLTQQRQRRALSAWQYRRFLTEGYLHLPRCLSQERVRGSLSFLLHHLGLVNGMVAGGIQGPQFAKFPGSVSNSDTLRAVLLSPGVIDVVRELFGGEDVFQRRSAAAQVAFRYPQFRSQTETTTAVDADSEAEEIEWHTDGFRQGHSHSFSVLLGVSLSSVESDFEGNLCVWPGSHFLLHRCRRGEHGGLDLRELCDLTQREEKFSSFFHPSQIAYREALDSKTETSDPSSERHNNSSSVLPCLGKPVQLRTQPGDIVLLHPDLAHGGAPNYSHSIREMLYFRLKIDHGPHIECFPSWEEVVNRQTKDMWADLPGVRNSLGEKQVMELTALMRD